MENSTVRKINERCRLCGKITVRTEEVQAGTDVHDLHVTGWCLECTQNRKEYDPRRRCEECVNKLWDDINETLVCDADEEPVFTPPKHDEDPCCYEDDWGWWMPACPSYEFNEGPNWKIGIGGQY